MIMRLDEIERDKRYYPRIHVDWLTVVNYKEAMKHGEKFPPVLVGILKGRNLLVDGWHRYESKSQLKEVFIDADKKHFESEKELFKEAIRLNAKHGKSYNVSDKAKIILELEKVNTTTSEIMNILGVSEKALLSIKGAKIRSISGTDTEIIIKKPLRYMDEIKQGMESAQEDLLNISQIRMLIQFETMLINKFFDLEDKAIKDKLVSIKALINKNTL